MEKSDIKGTAQVAAGGYLGYQGLKHGAHRALGLRMEFHTTSKENAKNIIKGGNILDPAFGGKNGWSRKVNCDSFIESSKGFVHITGMHPDHKNKLQGFIPEKVYNKVKTILPTLQRKIQCVMYKIVGNTKDFEKFGTMSTKEQFSYFVKALRAKDQTKKFFIPGTDKYFTKNFIADTDDIALKSSKKIKAYTNRFSATLAGLKKFGLSGIKQNKGRVALGAGVLAIFGGAGYKLIKNGIKNINADNEKPKITEQEKEKDINQERNNEILAKTKEINEEIEYHDRICDSCRDVDFNLQEAIE